MPWSKVAILGINFPIPYYMEIMGVDRPDCTYRHQKFRISMVDVEYQVDQVFVAGLL